MLWYIYKYIYIYIYVYIYIYYIYIYYIYIIYYIYRASQDESAACDFDKPEGGENQMITSTGNTPDTEEQHDNSNDNNFATYRRERLEG